MRFSSAIRTATVFLLVLAATVARAGPHIVVDLQSGAVLSHENAFKRWYPASLTKLMTIYVVLRAVEAGEITLTSPVKFTKAAAAQPPSKMYWGPGTVLNFDNAIKLLAVKSANDVAMAVAESLAGSAEAFATRMNAEAARLGMTGSHFVNANGLFAEQQYTTARDLGLLSIALRRDFPQHAHYFATEGVIYGKHDYANYNILLGRFTGADGMKTGYICASGFNLAASATRDGRTLIAVVLGAASQKQRAELAADLMAKGFGEAASGGVTLATLQPYGENRDTAHDMSGEVCTEEARKQRWDGRQVEGMMTFNTPNIVEMTRDPKLERVRIGNADGPVAPMAMALFFTQVPRPTPRPDYTPQVVQEGAGVIKAETNASAGAPAAALRPTLGIPVPTPRATAVN